VSSESDDRIRHRIIFAEANLPEKTLRSQREMARDGHSRRSASQHRVDARSAAKNNRQDRASRRQAQQAGQADDYVSPLEQWRIKIMTSSVRLVVRGIPVSFRSKRDVVTRWRNKVAAAAIARVPQLTDSGELKVSITHFYRSPPRYDADNMSKPICDALSHIVYEDDRQIVECSCRRVPLSRPVNLWGMPRELVIALCEADDFVYIVIEWVKTMSWSPFRERFARLWA